MRKMMRLSEKRERSLRRRIPAALLLMLPALLAFCFSCAASPKTPEGNFDLVSSRLESGGSVYFVGTMPDLVKEREKEGAAIRDAIWQELTDENGQPDEARLAQLDRTISEKELLWRLLGVSSVSGWGFSSVPAGHDAKIFRNRLFFAIDPDAGPGVLQELFAAEDQPFPFRPQDLPAESFFAAALYLRPRAIWDVLASAGKMGEDLLISGKDELPWEELAASTCGWWTVVFVKCEGENAFRIEIPDQNGNLTRFTRNACLYGLEFQEAANGRLLRSGPEGSLLVVLEKGKIVIYSPAQTELLFSASAPKLDGDPAFAAYSRDLPEKGIALAFVREGFGTAENFPLLFQSAAAWLPEGGISSFCGTLTRQNEGFLWCENGVTDWQKRILPELPDPVEFLLKMSCEEEETEEEEQQEQQESGETGASTDEPVRDREFSSAECRTRLERLGKALLHLRQPDGSFPAASSPELFQKLLDQHLITPQDLCCPAYEFPALPKNSALTWDHCAYCVFPWDGKGFQGKRRPLLMDRPGNHPDSFSVFFTDGTAETFTLVRPNSCRRLISHLSTVCRWEEADFRRLMEQAEKIDQQLTGE